MDAGLVIGIVGVLVGVVGALFAVQQWRDSRSIKKEIDGITRMLVGRQPEGAVRLAEAADDAAGRPTVVYQTRDFTPLRNMLADAISGLPEREKLVVVLYYYEQLSMREIAEVLGVSEAEAQEIHDSALMRLRLAHPARHEWSE